MNSGGFPFGVIQPFNLIQPLIEMLFGTRTSSMFSPIDIVWQNLDDGLSSKSQKAKTEIRQEIEKISSQKGCKLQFIV